MLRCLANSEVQMSDNQQNFTGKWLHTGEWQGKEFSHELADYDHDEHPGGTGATKMRHATVDQEGQKVGVWVPADWTDEQAASALENNW